MYVTDASTVPAKLEVRGNCKQETREGKNKLLCTESNFTQNGVTVTSVGNKITVKGTATTGFSIPIYSRVDNLGKLDVELNKTYCQTVIADGTIDGNIELNIANDVSNYYSQIKPKSNQTISNEKLYDSEIIKIFLWIANGITVNCTFSIQIEEGTEFTGFEEYGASPSLDYPSPVRALGDNVNMSDKDNINKILATPSNLTVIASSSGGASFYLKAKPNTAYTISREVLGQRFVASTSVEVPAVGTSLTQTIINNDGDAIHIKTSKNDNYLLVYYLYNNTENEEEILSSIKIEEGTEATSYSPYGQGSVEIKKINKNWAKIDTPRTVERGGLSITLDDEDVFTINGTATSNIYINLINITEYQNTTLTNYKLPLKNYKAYFDLISKNNSAVSESNADASLNIRNFGASATGEPAITYCVFGSLIKGNTGIQIKDCNITEDRVVAYLYIPNGAKLDNFKFRFALYNEDEPDTTYVKHEEQSLILDVQQPMLSGDYFVKEADGWKEVHTWNKAVLTGNENWSSQGMSSGLWCYFLIDNMYKTDSITGAYCNIATEKNSSEAYNSSTFCFATTVSGNLAFKVTQYTQLSQWKEYLSQQNTSGNPIYVYYKLATQTKLPCTEAQSNVLDQLNELELTV